MVYATVEELEARWRALGDSERKRAERLLEDASTVMAAAMRDSGLDPSSGVPTPEELSLVCCAVARRSMLAPPDLPALTQYSQGAGPLTESMTYANPTGDLYLTKSERRLLGIRGGRVFSVPPIVRGGAGDAQG